jgi:hypothetical protein
MTTDIEVDRVLATVTATLNDQDLEQFDAQRVQKIVTAALGGESTVTVDDGGGLHDENGIRVGAVRRTDSGEWITDRQNEDAAGSDTAVPRRPTRGVRGLLSKLKGG